MLAAVSIFSFIAFYADFQCLRVVDGGVFISTVKGCAAEYGKCSVCLSARANAVHYYCCSCFRLVNIGTLLGKLKIDASYVG